MAGNVFVKIRLWNPGKDCIYGDSSHVLPNYLQKKIVGFDQNVKYLEVFYAGATQADEELGTAADKVEDGTTTPFQIIVVSAQATDIDTDGGKVRKVALIGVTVSAADAAALNVSNAKLTVEVINMNGTTDVLSARYYVRLIHAYACDWGSGGGDAEGDITIESPADTDLQTIKATQNESNGCVFFFAAGDQPLLDFVQFGDTATLAAGDGVILECDEYGFERTTNVEADYPTLSYSYMHYGNTMRYEKCWVVPRLATLQTKLTWTHQLVGNSKTINIHFGLVVY